LTSDEAAGLVADGNADLLVEAQTGAAGPVVDDERDVALSNVTVLAGSDDDVLPSDVEELSTGENVLPKGTYLLLLGGSGPDYYLAMGIYGSFVVEGDSTSQQCPGGVGSTSDVATPLSDATTLLATALKQYAATTTTPAPSSGTPSH